jgi:hypothetical protein
MFHEKPVRISDVEGSLLVSGQLRTQLAVNVLSDLQNVPDRLVDL